MLGSGVAGSSIREAGGDVWQSEIVDGVGDSDFKTETFKKPMRNCRGCLVPLKAALFLTAEEPEEDTHDYLNNKKINFGQCHLRVG